MQRSLDIRFCLCKDFIMPPAVINWVVKTSFMRCAHLIITTKGNSLHLLAHLFKDQLLITIDTTALWETY